jgi:hypothetical protein
METSTRACSGIESFDGFLQTWAAEAVYETASAAE